MFFEKKSLKIYLRHSFAALNVNKLVAKTNITQIIQVSLFLFILCLKKEINEAINHPIP